MISPYLDPFDDRSKSRPTVAVVGEIDGLHGGRRLLLERIGRTWCSGYFETWPNAPQGDPRWFRDIAGDELAMFFGFEAKGYDVIAVPDQNDFCAGIAKLNARLPHDRRIEIAFYPTNPKRPYSTPSEYLASLATLARIPMSSAGPTALHDICFHTSAIFIPPEVWRLSRRQAAAVLTLTDALCQAFERTVPGPALKLLRKTILTTAVMAIDVGNGDLATALVGEHPVDDSYAKCYLAMTGGGLSPVEFAAGASMRGILACDATIDPSGALGSMMRARVLEYRAERSGGPEDEAPPPFSAAEFHEQVLSALRRIRAAVPLAS